MRSPKLLAQAGGYIGRYTVKHQPPPIQTENDLKASQDFEFFCGWLTRNKPTPLYPKEHMKPWIESWVSGKDSKVLKGIAGSNVNILSPRGSAKSTVLGLFLAWSIGYHASQGIGLKILYISYNLETARAKSAAIKNIVDSDEYKSIFPCVRKSERKWADDLWTIDYEYAGISGIGEDNYTLKAAGITGSIVSKRCLVAGSLITTDRGQIAIENLESYVGVGLNILSYNYETRRTEWKPLLGFAKRYSSDIVRVRTSEGTEVKCTADHDVYTVEHGKKQARDLLPGDTLISVTQENRGRQEMPNMYLSCSESLSLQNLLQRIKENICSVGLQKLWKRDRSFSKQTKKQNKERKQFILLLSELYSPIYYQTKNKREILQRLWNKNIKPNFSRCQEILSDMFGQNSSQKKTVSNHLSHLRESIPTKSNSTEALLEEMYGQAFIGNKKNIGGVWDRVQVDATIDLREGQSPMFSLRVRASEDQATGGSNKRFFSNPSSERNNFRQPSRKLNSSVHPLSSETSHCSQSWQTVTVSSVTAVSSGEVEVYDIEVADNHNFFVNNILSFNCHLIAFDDMIKNTDDIGNPEVRTKMERNYSQAIIPTLFEGGRMLGLGTRFRGDDIHCTQFIPDKGWHVIEQEAILKDDEGKETSYWEEFWSLDYLQAMRAADPLMFQYQYQNKIGQVSQIALSTKWIRFGEPPTQFDSMGIGVDLAASQKERSCFSVFTLIGKVANQFWILDYRRGRWVGNMEKCKEILDLYANWVEPDCFHPSLLDDELGEYTYHSELNRWTHPNQANRLTDSPKDGTVNKDGKVIYLPNAQNSLIPYIPTPKTPWRIFVEKAAYQISMKGDLQLFLHQQKGLDHIAITPLLLKGDKMGHLISISGGYSSGMVIYNKYVDWTEYNKEFTEFGVAAYCDCVDSAALALKGLGMRQKLDSAIDQLQVILGHGQQVG